MVLAGHWAGKQNLFFSYQRIYHLISPEGFFYPSLDNLTVLVSHLAAKEKILVVVGGNSVFAGVGQKKEELWTKELQRLLGEDFTVVNLAFSGALRWRWEAWWPKCYPRDTLALFMSPIGMRQW
jgi:hypothetical protein